MTFLWLICLTTENLYLWLCSLISSTTHCLWQPLICSLHLSLFVCLFTIPHISKILQHLSLSVYLHNINLYIWIYLYCYCSVAQSCPTLCDPMDCSTPDFPVFHHLLEFAQTHVHWVSGTIQPSHPLLSPSPAFNLSHHRFQWVSSSHQMVKVLELQLQHQSLQWICKVNFI